MFLEKYFVVHDMSPKDEDVQNVYRIGIAKQEDVAHSGFTPGPSPTPPGPGPNPNPTPETPDSPIGEVEILIFSLVFLCVICTVCYLYRRNK